ncbi:hypothetical protein GCM10027445_63620 [Amycolatopsis endophytica]|uniref:Cell division protein FtsB n=1 Tax=Amycolatopsis endophytica TaxID=860233 RepID=A0A853BE50_9PSEU|nr:hypothetical protein [Amycolatopsis endophytica]NYI92867.1 cell division protein FtsB [Amycolatopsis endophytica]
MTAPTRTRRQATAEPRRRPRRSDVPVEEGLGTPVPARRRRSAPQAQRSTTAAERAYARRAQRAEGLKQSAPEPERQKARIKLRLPRSRATFVLLVMMLLAAGVVVTLLLSTQAIADSYRLEQLREDNAGLAERVEQLQQDVSGAESPSSLAERAKALGMVPAGDPAHLVQNADGTVTVVGEPKKAEGAPVTQATEAPMVPPSTPAGGRPIEGDVAQGESQATGQTTGQPADTAVPSAGDQAPGQQTTGGQ